MAAKRDKFAVRHRLAEKFEAGNREAAAVILADPERYTGLPQMWAESFVKGDKTMATQFQPDRYLVRGVNQCFTRSQQKNTLGFNLAFRVLKNLDKPDAVVQNYQRDTTWWITDKTAKRILRELQAIGYEGSTLSGVDPDTEDFYDFRGREFELVCTHEDTEAGTFERWSVCAGKQPTKDKSMLQLRSHCD